MTQLVVASTLFGAATAAAAADSGLLDAPGKERVLLVVNDSPAPELSPALDENAAAEPILKRFERVVHLTNLIAPIHPSDWTPGERDLPLLSRLLRRYWVLGDEPIHLVLESIAAKHAESLARIFHDSRITVFSTGLMGYGPTPSRLPLSISQRLAGLVHLDLVPGVRPVLFSELGIPARAIPNGAVRSIVEEISATAGTVPPADSSSAIVIGQDPAMDMLSRDEGTKLQASMVYAAAADGARLVRFMTHQSAPPGVPAPIARAAKAAGIDLEVVRGPLPVEALLVAAAPVAVVGCCSTSLMTAKTIFGVRSVSVDITLMLERLAPYENSHRIPVTIIDASHRDSTPYPTTDSIQRLIETVAYCMHPERLPGLRPTAEALLSSAPEAESRRYVGKGRLSALRLPGAPALAGPRRRFARLLRAIARHTPARNGYRWARGMARRARRPPFSDG